MLYFPEAVGLCKKSVAPAGYRPAGATDFLHNPTASGNLLGSSSAVLILGYGLSFITS